MAIIKAYTDIQQSEKLAEILPIESADMGWNVFVDGTTRILPIDDWDLVRDGSGNVKFYPAWSVAALLTILNKDFYPNIFHDGVTWNLEVTHHDDNTIKYETCGDDILDICFRMIVFYTNKNFCDYELRKRI